MNKNTQEILAAWFYVLVGVFGFTMMVVSLLSTCHGR